MAFNLREARHNAGLSLKELADEIPGTSPATLGRAETGVTVPQLQTCLAIARYWASKGYVGDDGEPLRVTDIWPVSKPEAAAA